MQNLHFQTSLLLGVAFKSVHNLTPPHKKKWNSILFLCLHVEKTHWALNTLLGFNTNTWNLNEMIVILKKTTTLSSWACRKISVLLFLDRAPMGSGGKGGSGGCLSCGFVNIYFVINMPLWTDLLIFRRQARERHLARLTHGTTFGSCHSSPNQSFV